MLSPFELTLNALLDGIPITIDKQTFRYFKKDDEIVFPSMTGIALEPKLCIELENNSRKVYVGADIGFSQFISMLQSVSEEDALNYAMSNAYNKTIKRPKRNIGE